MELKHTPGPWQYRKADDTLLGRKFAVTAGTDAVCQVVAKPGLAEANARLIALAPELAIFVKRYHDLARVIQFGDEHRGFIQTARTLVSRVTGEVIR